ncbi:MAG: peptidoglycan editing factor PgeF [Edaphobacter sp.]|uniref:peptidoglycan editing factor PgeF n=1 Tax=Edaphobacter sp. TaxID=1934404 RepID=UPI00238F3A86|nr:peptidoglycan editing factor PgeF [Edaphobacter sp.]MDE1176266.1 peptidoglycan editing factor PgeF [Edaphobacter sp.]
MSTAQLVRVASFLSFPWLRHGFSTRQGGRSSVYGGSSLNLGWTREDEPANVHQNRSAFVQEVSGNGAPMKLVTVRQIHSAIVQTAGAEAFDAKLETEDGKAVLEGDGLITNTPGVLIAAGTADCVPVLVVDPVLRAVGAFHAGWRGTVAGIVGEGIALMRQEYGSEPGNLVAAIGPSIGSCCYTVGEEVREQFSAAYPYSADLFQEKASSEGAPSLTVDLWEANRRQLLDAGLSFGNVSVVGECTACTRMENGERRYFSHRDEHGHAGRMLNAIGIVAIA